MNTAQKLKQKQVHHAFRISQPPRYTQVKVSLVTRPMLAPCAKTVRCVFTSKTSVHPRTDSFAAVCESFSKAHSDKEVPNKTVHRFVTFPNTGSVVSQSNKTTRTAAVPIPSCESDATMGYGCKN
jgi:hypothetical protein